MARMETVRTSEIRVGHTRLDGSFYCSEGESVRRLLIKCSVRTDTLEKVAESITNEGRGRRMYVADHSHGVQLLSSSDILLADFSGAHFISKRTPNVSLMLLKRGWTLISCSGTIGNVAYAHADFEGRAASQHVMRVAPNARIRSGYLFTWLSGRAGVALLKRCTYGSVIPTIEPPTVLDLPVARLADPVEEAIHERVEAAAAKRVEASRTLREARKRVYEVTGLPRIDAPVGRNLAGLRAYVVSQSSLGTRFDGRYHDIVIRNMLERIRSNPKSDWTSLGECVGSIFLPDRGKWVGVSIGGIPFVSSGSMFEACPKPTKYVSPLISAGVRQLIVRKDDILVARSGQIYSILGDVIMVGRTLDRTAVTDDTIRIRPDATLAHPGYVFAFLSLPDYGYGQIVRTAAGTSIPHVLVDELPNVMVPMPSEEERNVIGDKVFQAIELRDQANDLEDEAQALLERALDEATGGGWSKLSHRN